MMRVHILSPGMTSPNGRAFLFPLLVWRRQLEAAGIHWRLFHERTPALFECDHLILDCRYYTPRWRAESATVEDELAEMAAAGPQVIWYDNTDSTGWDHARALPRVHKFVKNQLLKDRRRYLEPIYGAGRVFAEYYHRTAGVADADACPSEPVVDADQLTKLRLGWNSGLADYSLWGPTRMAAFQRVPWQGLLSFPRACARPDSDRPLPFAARFGLGYARASVAHQRRRMAEILRGRTATAKVGRRAYYEELKRAAIVVSPFGLGEITLKDFETFLAGSALLKPSMDHMETWPQFFRPGETILTHGWDLDDLDTVIEAALKDSDLRLDLAMNGQKLYLRHTRGPEAAALFAQHLHHILTS